MIAMVQNFKRIIKLKLSLYILPIATKKLILIIFMMAADFVKI